MNQKDRITEEILSREMKTRIFGRIISYKEEIDSTNTEAKRLGEAEGEHGLLVIAEEQTQGKGRRGRSWNSPKGTGIFMSLLLKPKQELKAEKASMLTLITALSVADAISEVTGLEASIKWPNDIVIGNKKVCGILTEMSADNTGIRYVVIGIGINVNTAKFPEEIRKIATSLFIEKGQELINRSHLAASVLEKLEQYYDMFLVTKDLGFLTEAYNKKLVNQGRLVKVLGSDGQVQMSGEARGINKEGELLVKTEEGLLEVRSGEVSVRGLYGYV